MNLLNNIRGHMIQNLMVSLFEHGGFRVTRLGIEDVFDDIKHLSQADYLNLGLPMQLRSLPDLLITDPDVKKAWLIEIKYRSRWDEGTMKELYDTLTEQRRYWRESWAIIIRGDVDRSLRYHQDFIRVIPPARTNGQYDSLQELIPKPTEAMISNLKEIHGDDWEKAWKKIHGHPNTIWENLLPQLTSLSNDSAKWHNALGSEQVITRIIKALASA